MKLKHSDSYFSAEKELVEFLTEEILAERKAQKMKTIPTELDGFKAELNGAEVTLTKQMDSEMYYFEMLSLPTLKINYIHFQNKNSFQCKSYS